MREIARYLGELFEMRSVKVSSRAQFPSPESAAHIAVQRCKCYRSRSPPPGLDEQMRHDERLRVVQITLQGGSALRKFRPRDQSFSYDSNRRCQETAAACNPHNYVWTPVLRHFIPNRAGHGVLCVRDAAVGSLSIRISGGRQFCDVHSFAVLFRVPEVILNLLI